MVGRNSTLSFWYGKWSKEGPLRQLIQGPLPWDAANWGIKDILGDSGLDWSCMPFIFPTDIKEKLQATPFSLTSKGGDKLAWAENPMGCFELKSAYKVAMGVDTISLFTARWLWKAPTLPRIKTFIWQCAHNSIGVKECLTRRSVMEDVVCPICRREDESILHALRDCPWAQSAWRQLGV